MYTPIPYVKCTDLVLRKMHCICCVKLIAFTVFCVKCIELLLSTEYMVVSKQALPTHPRNVANLPYTITHSLFMLCRRKGLRFNGLFKSLMCNQIHLVYYPDPRRLVCTVADTTSLPPIFYYFRTQIINISQV